MNMLVEFPCAIVIKNDHIFAEGCIIIHLIQGGDRQCFDDGAPWSAMETVLSVNRATITLCCRNAKDRMFVKRAFSCRKSLLTPWRDQIIKRATAERTADNRATLITEMPVMLFLLLLIHGVPIPIFLMKRLMLAYRFCRLQLQHRIEVIHHRLPVIRA
jgi:hypothetical protein